MASLLWGNWERIYNFISNIYKSDQCGIGNINIFGVINQVLCLVDDRFPGQVRQSATLESLVVALGDNIKTLLSDIQSLKEGQATQAKEALRLHSDLLDVRKESVDYFIKSMGTKG